MMDHMFTEAFETLGESAHDARVVPIKEYFSADGGSYVTLGLYVSFIASWSTKSEFLSSLKLLHISKAIKTQKGKHFEKLLEWFNTYSPDEIKIVPHYKSLKEVIFDE